MLNDLLLSALISAAICAVLWELREAHRRRQAALTERLLALLAQPVYWTATDFYASTGERGPHFLYVCLDRLERAGKLERIDRHLDHGGRVVYHGVR